MYVLCFVLYLLACIICIMCMVYGVHFALVFLTVQFFSYKYVK